MRFSLTMHMPNGKPDFKGMYKPVHQVVCEVPVNSCEELCDLLTNNDFIVVHQYYSQTDEKGMHYWVDRGDIVINTSWVGKAHEVIDRDQEYAAH